MTEAHLRPALLRDIPALLKLINSYAAQGIMLPRTEFEMAENIRDFSLAESEGGLVACAALHFYTPESAEIRSLAVNPGEARGGWGRRIVEHLEKEAHQHGLSSLFAFTYVPGFFEKLDFSVVDRSELPLKAWKDCLRCPKFQACDEIAMVKWIRPQAAQSTRLPILPPIHSPALPVIKTTR